MYVKTGLIAAMIIHIQIVHSQNQVTLETVTSTPYQCAKEIELKCTYTGSDAWDSNANRIWRVDGALVMTNGIESSDMKKYSEGEINTSEKFFILIIKSIDEADLKKKYSCRYSADELLTALTIGDSCMCQNCIWRCVLYALLGELIGIGMTLLVDRVILKSVPQRNQLIKVVTVAIVYCVISIIAGALSGNFLCPCLSSLDSVFIAIFLIPGIALTIIIVVHHKLKDKDPHVDDTHMFSKISMTILTLGTWIVVLKCLLKDEKNSSPESGSPEKERAVKKKDKKPTEVVRPQPSRPVPSRAQHLKTDNTGREDYSTENEMFKPRPLPNISGHSDSPRPLPKRTPDDQLEKGGIQLEPLVDYNSEKKKKKEKKEEGNKAI